MKPVDTQPTDAPAEGAPAPQGGNIENASPEEQQQYEKIMTAALAQLYGDDTTHAAIVKKLSDERENLAHAVGHTAAMMLKSAEGNAGQQGVELAPAAMLQAGADIVAELIEICVAAKLVPEGKPAEDLFTQSCLEATKAYGQSLEDAGMVTPQVRQQADASFKDGLAREKAAGLGPKRKGLVGGAMSKQQPTDEEEA